MILIEFNLILNIYKTDWFCIKYWDKKLVFIIQQQLFGILYVPTIIRCICAKLMAEEINDFSAHKKASLLLSKEALYKIRKY